LCGMRPSAALALLVCAVCAGISACKTNGVNTRSTDAQARPTHDPCADSLCGQACTLCAPDDPGCQEPVGNKACDALGACRPVPVTCSEGHEVEPASPAGAYAPCAGKQCGEPCTMCPPGDAACVETGVLKQCTAEGACMPGGAQCQAPGEAPGQDAPEQGSPERAPAL
jgi:hypothetical protein